MMTKRRRGRTVKARKRRRATTKREGLTRKTKTRMGRIRIRISPRPRWKKSMASKRQKRT